MFAGVPSDQLVSGTQPEFGDVVEALDVVTDLSQIVDCRSLNVLVCEDSIRHQSRTSSGSVVKCSWSSTASSRWCSTARISSGWSW